MKRLFLLTLAAVILLGLAFSGCDLLKPGEKTTGVPQASVATSAPTAATATTERKVPQSTGTLNLLDIDPITLDPARAADFQSSQYIVQIFSGLVQLDEKQQPVPDIAQSWDLSPDGKTYTFRLRRDVQFHNGKALTAADVKYSWERACNPATRSSTAATYLGDIVGVRDMLSGGTTTLSGVKVLDDYTLQVTIDVPKSYFLYKLTYPTAFVVDSRTVSSGEWWRSRPNGTGPFKLTGWEQNKSLTLERNTSYYGNIAQISQVKYQFYTGQSMDLYETGQIDATRVSVSFLDKVTDKAGPFTSQLSVTPQLDFTYVGFNCAQPPFDDARVRQAFNMAIDKDKLVSLIYRNTVQKADGVLPPGMPGYNPGVKGLSFDASKAKDLIKTSKYGDVSRLPPITFTTSGYGANVGPLLQSLVYQWKQNLGIDVQIRQLETERLLYNFKEEVDQMFDMGWIADYPHPQDFLDILFSTGGDTNYGSYSNSQFDSLIQQANRSLETGKSFPLYQHAEQILVDDAACLPLFFSKNYTLAKPYIKGYNVNAIGMVQLNKVVINPH